MAKESLVDHINYCKINVHESGKCEVVVMGKMTQPGTWGKKGRLIRKPPEECEEGVCAFEFKAVQLKEYGHGKDPVKATCIIEDCEACEKVEICYEGGSEVKYINQPGSEWPTPETDPEWEEEPEEEYTPEEDTEDEQDDVWEEKKTRSRKRRPPKRRRQKHHGSHDQEEEYDPWDEHPRKKRRRKNDCSCGETCPGGEVECLLGLHVVGDHLIIRVKSNGDTCKEDFKFCVFKGCTGKEPYMIEFCRCKPDNGHYPKPNGVKLKFHLSELCLHECQSFTVRNPICCEVPEPETW